MVARPVPARHSTARTWLRLAVAAAAALLVAGCSSPEPTSAPSGPAGYDQRGPITLAQGKDISGFLPKEVAAWNADHPDQKVTLTELPESADSQRQLLLQNAQVKSDTYTIVTLDAVWTAEFAANGWVDPLPEGTVDLSGYLEPTLQTVTYFGKVYGVPQATGAGLLYYRKDLLDAAGLKPPTTWAELKQACAAITRSPGNDDLDCYAGQYQKYEGLTVNFSEAVLSAGGQVVDAEGKAVVDSPEAKRGLDFLIDAFRDRTIPRGAITWQEEQGRQAFQNGKLIFLRNWGYVYSLAEKTDGSSKVAGRFAVAPLPGLDGPGVSVLGGNNYAISAFATNKGTAVEFIEWLNRPSEQKARMLAASVPPPLESVYTDPEVVAKYPYMPTLLTAIKSARPRPVAVRYGDVTLAIQDVAYDALRGTTSSDQALATLQSRLEPLLTK